MAAFDVVIDQTHRLHKSVQRGGSNERPAAVFQVFRHGNRCGGCGAGFERLVSHRFWAICRTELLRPNVITQ